MLSDFGVEARDKVVADVAECEVYVCDRVANLGDIHIEARAVAVPGLEVPNTNEALWRIFVVSNLDLAAVGNATIRVRLVRPRSIVDACIGTKLVSLAIATVSITSDSVWTQETPALTRPQ